MPVRDATGTANVRWRHGGGVCVLTGCLVAFCLQKRAGKELYIIYTQEELDVPGGPSPLPPAHMAARLHTPPRLPRQPACPAVTSCGLRACEPADPRPGQVAARAPGTRALPPRTKPSRQHKPARHAGSAHTSQASSSHYPPSPSLETTTPDPPAAGANVHNHPDVIAVEGLLPSRNLPPEPRRVPLSNTPMTLPGT